MTNANTHNMQTTLTIPQTLEQAGWTLVQSSGGPTPDTWRAHRAQGTSITAISWAANGPDEEVAELFVGLPLTSVTDGVIDDDVLDAVSPTADAVGAEDISALVANVLAA